MHDGGRGYFNVCFEELLPISSLLQMVDILGCESINYSVWSSNWMVQATFRIHGEEDIVWHGFTKNPLKSLKALIDVI